MNDRDFGVRNGVLMEELERLLWVMARLRDPQGGCPWDLAQDFASIAPYTIEEAYEVADAISRGNRAALKDELGDLLFQVVFHARLAQEEGSFDFASIAAAVADKLVRRHPHVFGETTYASESEQHAAWEQIKAAERGAEASVFAGVPLALPALARAAKLQQRAARVGFDWPEAAPVLAKVEEELGELQSALSATEDHRRVAEELGDLLFACVNLARHLRVDPEAALRAASDKFVRRFQRIETVLREQDRLPEDLDLDQLDNLWEDAKAQERLAD